MKRYWMLVEDPVFGGDEKREWVFIFTQHQASLRINPSNVPFTNLKVCP